MISSRVLSLLLISVVAALGYRSVPNAIAQATGPTSALASSTERLAQAPTVSPVPTTTTPPSSNTTPSGSQVTYPARVFYQHPSRACLSNADGSPVACNPPGLDILSVTITRPEATGPLTINLELAGNGIKDLRSTPLWGLTYAFDLDRNVATGRRDVYPTQHHVGPEVDLIYGEVNGAVKQIVQQYAPDGKETDGDTSLAVWTFPDDNHIQAVVDPGLIPSERFYVVGDIATNDMFDHFVENGYLTFPEGQAVSSNAGTPPATPAAVATTSQTSSTPMAGVIAQAFMAQDLKGMNAPVGITNAFPAGQGKVHAVVQTQNAPKGTRVKAAWTAVDVGSAAAPNFKLGEYEVAVYGTQFLDFNFQPNGGQMVPGKYRVDLYVNGALDRSLDFSVAADGTPVPTPASPTVAVGSCLAPTSAPQPSGLIAKITTTTGTQGADLSPVDSTTVFAPNATFHAVVAIQNAPTNTKVTAQWFATDVGDMAPCNATLTDPTDLVTQGSRNLDFNLSPQTVWPTGKYRVEIYMNDVLNSIAEFTVK